MSAPEQTPVTAYIALGANLGDPQATILKAVNDLALIHGVSLVKCSSLYQTAPLDAGGPDYVNAVVELQTILTAPALLAQLQALEQAAGRQRPFRNAPRTLDLDLLTYGDARIQSEALTIPHPRMGERAFVLVPLAEIAPQAVSAAQLLAVQSQCIKRL
ncbi:2-amino-4-hydroxy-6-hydroxymethyldihydropteridine diphosphokinase [Rhodoferax ferrireducens]|uniref:2-amino-4-hydroxy-6- hydroxymethyldihydropteridine diphosphokinase n=1 Tax=Rhodoferax ferrireducens TaxID=192843 RepID=UPI003BB567CE